MRHPINLTQDQRQRIMEISATLKGKRTYFELGQLMGTDPSMMQRVVVYGNPPSAEWLLWWAQNSPHADVKEWARQVLIIRGLIDKRNGRDGTWNGWDGA